MLWLFNYFWTRTRHKIMDVSRETPDFMTKPKCYDLANTLAWTDVRNWPDGPLRTASSSPRCGSERWRSLRSVTSSRRATGRRGRLASCTGTLGYTITYTNCYIILYYMIPYKLTYYITSFYITLYYVILHEGDKSARESHPVSCAPQLQLKRCRTELV